jgi:two-component system nitrate/nitrite response regulator NarL
MTAPPTEPDVTAPPRPIAVLVVDDQPTVREALVRLIGCVPLALRAVQGAGNSAEALEAARTLRPEVIVLDVDLGGEDGLALLPQLTTDARVLVLSSRSDAATRARALQGGASAFVDKQEPAAVLLGCLVDLASRPALVPAAR